MIIFSSDFDEGFYCSFDKKTWASILKKVFLCFSHSLAHVLWKKREWVWETERETEWDEKRHMAHGEEKSQERKRDRERLKKNLKKERKKEYF
jgi:hypothetical protein